MLGRLRRAVRRQFGAFLGHAFAAAAIGAIYIYVSGFNAEAVMVWSVFALAFGLTVAVSREIGRDTIGSPARLSRKSGFDIVGAGPHLSKGQLRELPPQMRNPMGCVIYQPSSSFAAAFRDLHDEIGDSKLVAFVGSVPNEGATTTALCCALSAAQQGRRVIILDCDVRRRSLTRWLDSAPETGVTEAAQHPDTWRAAVLEETETGLHYIPAAPTANPWRNLFSQPGLPVLFETLREHYDLIVLDCPPALSMADGAMIARAADKCVIVATWDETPTAALRAMLRNFRRRAPAAAGVYVNRVPPRYRFAPG